MTNLLCPWEDVPEPEKADRKIRSVKMLRRVHMGSGRVAEVGSIERVPHPFALSLVRDRQAEPIT